MSEAASGWEGLGVAILTYGTGGQHRPLLESLLAEGIEPGQIVLVHNPSAPGEQAPEAPAGCEVILASHNLGYAAAMNLGIERQLQRDREHLLLLTHDARLRPGALARLLEAARANPELGVAGPVLVLTGTETPYSFGGVNRANGSVGHRPSEPPAVGGVAFCDWVDGGTMLIRAEALRLLGGFDERFWGSPEEPWAVAVGMTRGIADFARGRWGPPPTSLPGASDMTNLEPPAQR